MRDIYDDRVLDSCARFSGSGAAKTAKTVLSFNICSCCCLLPHGSGVRPDLVPFQISVDPTLLVACCVRGQPLLFAWHPVSPVAWSGQVWSHVGFRWIHVSVNMRPLSEFDARRGPVPDLRVLQEFEDVKRGDLANLASNKTKHHLTEREAIRYSSGLMGLSICSSVDDNARFRIPMASMELCRPRSFPQESSDRNTEKTHPIRKNNSEPDKFTYTHSYGGRDIAT